MGKIDWKSKAKTIGNRTAAILKRKPKINRSGMRLSKIGKTFKFK